VTPAHPPARPTDRYPQVGHAVAELAAAVRAGQDSAAILGRVCGYARALTGARTVAALTTDPDGALVVRSVAGRIPAWRPGLRVPAVDTLARSAIADRKPVAAELRRCRHRQERELAAAGVRRVIYVPIPGYGSVPGVLGVGYRGGGAATDRELSLLEPMAVVAGLVPPTGEVDCAAVQERAAVGEREWLARELHDSVEQSLYGISLGAVTASELLRRDPPQAQQPLTWIQQTAAAGLTDLRGLILRLRPEALAGNGLTVALNRLLSTVEGVYGCRTVADFGAELAASAEVQGAIYRIAQEAVQNAARHARATQVTLRVHCRDSAVHLEVIDDGQGFVPDGDFPGRLGLRSMHERAAAAGGRLEIVSRPGSGTVVRAVLPAEGS
jgi:signal transduction histidine kinase